MARAKAQTIDDSNITFERFAPTLQKYGKSQSTVLKVVSVIQDSKKLTIKELWDKYLTYKAFKIKQSTLDFHEKILTQTEKLKDDLNYDALVVKSN